MLCKAFRGVMAPRRSVSVRVSSVLTAVLVVFVYGYLSHYHDNSQPKHMLDDNIRLPTHTRHLLSYRGRVDSNYGYDIDGNYSNGELYGESSKGNDSGCHSPLQPPAEYHGNSCQYVRDHCSGQTALINYLSFIMCDLGHLKPLAYALLAVWLVYLISLLATTADHFFLPPLNLLADKLRLPPIIAAVTLLAVGKGAPDIFTAYAALNTGHISLMLGALIGASVFISTVVLGTTIVFTKVDNINKVGFFRDVTAFILAAVLIVVVSLDGKVVLYEALLFPVFYIVYISVVIFLNCLTRWCKRRKKRWTRKDSVAENTPLLINTNTSDKESLLTEIAHSIEDTSTSHTKLKLEGLTWPRGKHIGVKVQWLCEWPFSFLRWLTIPPCCQDGHWTQWHHWFAVSSPAPMALLLLLATNGWEGFNISLSKLPIFWLLILLGVLLSLLLFFLLHPSKPPHWAMQAGLGVAALLTSGAWLYLLAHEAVTLLNSFGVVFGIDTALLGLTVLAIGNSVGDWITNTAVSRSGHPEMGVASSFQSPLLRVILGLSVALLAEVSFHQHGRSIPVPIHAPGFSTVKLSWIFLGVSLFASAVIFPLCKFKPPMPYGVALIYVYVTFIIFAVLDEVGVVKIALN